MTDGRVECTFLWLIENYSYCWHKIGEKLISPEFTADGLEGTVWTLQLYPRSDDEEAKEYVSLFLTRSEYDDGPVDFFIKYELSILAKKVKNERTYLKGDGYGWGEFIKRDEILLLRKDDYLPGDTLSVRCKMWKGQGNINQATEITARTRIGIEEISFFHVANSFRKMEPNEKKAIEIKSPSEQNCALTSSVYFFEDLSEGKIFVEITPSGENQILAKCKISLLDTTGKKIECCKADNRLDTKREDIQKLPLSLTRQAILSGDYLQDDNLSLSFECIFSTGVENEKIEKTLYQKPFVASNQNIKSAGPTGIYNAAQKLAECPSAMDNLKTMYDNRLLTDVELQTKTKSFPAHKSWLCARSPVFEAMLTSDMKEKNSGIIPIDDFEDNTVQQLLLFLYTDKFEELCWESAMKLYSAGDKYQIERLKVICSSFLLDKVSASSASELLALADTHNDSDLKEAVEDFILKHTKQVFGSEEWKKLSEENPQLAIKTMLLKYEKRSADAESSPPAKKKRVTSQEIL